MWLVALLALLQNQPAGSVSKDVVRGATGDELILSAPRTGVTLKMSGNTLSSATINVTKYEGNTMRGNYTPGRRSLPIDIRWTEDRVSGLLGPLPQLNLKVRKTEEGIKVDGMFRGISSHFRIGYGILDGRIGSCRYNLVQQTDEYEGERTCDGNVPEKVSFRLPKKIAQRQPSEIVAFLAVVFLGQRD